MANDIVPSNVQTLVDGWLKAEQEGERFPVPFDAAWVIAGYSTKANGKRGLKALKEGRDFSSELMKNSRRGRSSELIKLSCDAFKHLCLMAETSEGESIRDYFIETEKKWKLVQEMHPSIAQEIELERLRFERAKLEAQKAQTDLQLVQFRHIVTTTMPEPIQQKILGYSEIKTIEYRDRVIHNEEVINDGSTILKGALCHRYGLLTRNGKPDYKRLNALLERMPSEAFQLSVAFRDNLELRRDYLPTLDRLVDEADRNFYLGE